MASIDTKTNMTIIDLFKPDARTDLTHVGNTIDMKDYESLSIYVHTGTITDGTHTFAIYEGDASDMSDEAAVGSDFVIGSLPVLAAADDDDVFVFGYVGKKRYVRTKCVTAGSTTGGIFAVGAIKMNKRVAPTADQVVA